MTRIVIAGGPRTGKTTLADWLNTGPAVAATQIRHTDDLMHMGWSEASEYVATEWLGKQEDWAILDIIEGVAMPRALRKWLRSHSEGMPCDVAIWLSEPHEELSCGQMTMAKGCETVWTEIVDELRERGVVIR